MRPGSSAAATARPTRNSRRGLRQDNRPNPTRKALRVRAQAPLGSVTSASGASSAPAADVVARCPKRPIAQPATSAISTLAPTRARASSPPSSGTESSTASTARSGVARAKAVAAATGTPRPNNRPCSPTVPHEQTGMGRPTAVARAAPRSPPPLQPGDRAGGERLRQGPRQRVADQQRGRAVPGQREQIRAVARPDVQLDETQAEHARHGPPELGRAQRWPRAPPLRALGSMHEHVGQRARHERLEHPHARPLEAWPWTGGPRAKPMSVATDEHPRSARRPRAPRRCGGRATRAAGPSAPGAARRQCQAPPARRPRTASATPSMAACTLSPPSASSSAAPCARRAASPPRYSRNTGSPSPTSSPAIASRPASSMACGTRWNARRPPTMTSTSASSAPRRLGERCIKASMNGAAIRPARASNRRMKEMGSTVIRRSSRSGCPAEGLRT